MASWHGFEQAAPDLGGAGRRLLVGADGVAIGFLATVGSSGAPHLSPVCPIFCGADLYVSAGAHTPKASDLRRSGTYVLHAPLAADDEEFQVAGRALEVEDAAERRAVHAAIPFAAFKTTDPIFRLRIDRALWVHWERVGQPDTRAVRRRWPTGGAAAIGAPAESTSAATRGEAAQRVRAVLERLDRDGFAIARSDGSRHDVRTVAISAAEGDALRRWVSREKATRTIEIGLGYGVSTLAICEGLIRNGSAEARHVALDPFQAARFGDCGLQHLEEAGVGVLVEHHAEPSQIALPGFLKHGRRFDFAFVDGNHRFDSVFLDLFYLGRLLPGGGVVMLDDYDLPGVRKAVSFFQANLGWTIEERAPVEDRSRWVVVRTARHPDERDFRFFAEF